MEKAPLNTLASAIGILAVITLGCSAGAMLAEGAVLVPFWRSLPPESFLSWYAANASRLFDFFGPLEIGSTVLAIASLALYRYQPGVRRGLLGVSAVLAAAVLAAFPLYFEDVNASFAAGTIHLDRIAAELARWAGWHWARTAIGIGAFTAAILSRAR